VAFGLGLGVGGLTLAGLGIQTVPGVMEAKVAQWETQGGSAEHVAAADRTAEQRQTLMWLELGSGAVLLGAGVYLMKDMQTLWTGEAAATTPGTA